ncbi:MAG: tetratricopeptide repeat protein [Deltaproteobacteria bacterium]|nr:tetratricopeptide repeat protein [Deltaproteobacteria bacterium]
MMRHSFISGILAMLLLSGCATVQSTVRSNQEYVEGERLYKSQHYAEAQTHALKAYNEDPTNPLYQSLLGWVYLKQGNLTEARRLFTDMYNHDQGSLPAFVGLAWVEYSSGQMGQSEIWFQKELASAKDHVGDKQNFAYYSPNDQDFITSCLSDANYGLGLIALARHDYSGARAYLSEALKYPNSFIGHEPIRAALEESQGIRRRPEFAYNLKQGKPSKASLEKLIKTDPYSADTPQVAQLIAKNQEWQPLQKEFARAYFELGDFKRAQEKLQAYLRHAPRDDEARTMDAWCDMYMGRLPLALSKFNTLTRRKKSNMQAVLGRGVTELYMGKLDQADADFKQVQAREPNNVRARVARGAVAYLRGDMPQAIKIYNANLPYLPKKEPYFSWSSHALNNLGWAYIRTGRYQEALQTFQRLKDHHTRPIYPQAYDGMGWTYLYMGKNEEAKQAFQQSLQLAPDDVVAKNGLAKLATAQK